MAALKRTTEVATELAAFFRRNGYVRYQNEERLRSEGRAYKKGDEIRLIAMSAQELQRIRQLLCQAGFTPAKPFRKWQRWCQPVYGRSDVVRFLAMIDEA